MSCFTQVASDTSLSLEWARRARPECIDLKLLGNSYQVFQRLRMYGSSSVEMLAFITKVDCSKENKAGDT